MDLERAHKFCRDNRVALSVSGKAGCFYCLRIFPASDIKEWVDKARVPRERWATALCPFCSIDSVLADHDVDITPDFLNTMRTRYFETWAAAAAGALARHESAIATLDLLQLNHDRSPWQRTRTIEDWLRLVGNELVEAKIAIDGPPYDLADELSDVISNALQLAIRAEALGHGTVAELFDRARVKILERKPWLLTGPYPETPEQEVEIWDRIKAERKSKS